MPASFETPSVTQINDKVTKSARNATTAQNAAGNAANYNVINQDTGSSTPSGVAGAAKSATDSAASAAAASADRALAQTAKTAAELAELNAETWTHGTPPDVTALGGTFSAEHFATDAGLEKEQSRKWAEGTDVEVQNLGGVHSAKGWSEEAADIVTTIPTISVPEIGAGEDAPAYGPGAVMAPVLQDGSESGRVLFYHTDNLLLGLSPIHRPSGNTGATDANLLRWTDGLTDAITIINGGPPLQGDAPDNGYEWTFRHPIFVNDLDVYSRADPGQEQRYQLEVRVMQPDGTSGDWEWIVGDGTGTGWRHNDLGAREHFTPPEIQGLTIGGLRVWLGGTVNAGAYSRPHYMREVYLNGRVAGSGFVPTFNEDALDASGSTVVVPAFGKGAEIVDVLRGGSEFGKALVFKLDNHILNVPPVHQPDGVTADLDPNLIKWTNGSTDAITIINGGPPTENGSPDNGYEWELVRPILVDELEIYSRTDPGKLHRYQIEVKQVQPDGTVGDWEWILGDGTGTGWYTNADPVSRERYKPAEIQGLSIGALRFWLGGTMNGATYQRDHYMREVYLRGYVVGSGASLDGVEVDMTEITAAAAQVEANRQLVQDLTGMVTGIQRRFIVLNDATSTALGGDPASGQFCGTLEVAINRALALSPAPSVAAPAEIVGAIGCEAQGRWDFPISHPSYATIESVHINAWTAQEQYNAISAAR